MPDQSLISQRALSLRPSLTLEISSKANALKAQGRDICSLSAGEPDFNTPEFIVEAGIKALKDGRTRYGPAAGDPELREAIADKLSKTNKINTTSDQVLITNGGKQAIFNLFQIILDAGDEVIIPSPYWLSYPQIVKLSGAKPIYINSTSKDGFSLDLKSLEESITEKTKLLILNSPNNPTGRVTNKKELLGIAEILMKHPKVFVMSDEIYEFIIAKDEIHHSFAAIAPQISDRVFTVNGFAKGWAMTGWRIGYLSGPKEIIKTAIALQSQSTSNVCSFAQRGALAAILGPKDCLDLMRESYSLRRDILTNSLKQIPQISLVAPSGAFYAFPDLSSHINDSIAFCKLALDKVGLAMIPGGVFGENQCVRLSSAVDEETIQDGVNRLKVLLESI